MPKIGDPIPGTNLLYEAEDIANINTNLQADQTAITAKDLTPASPITLPVVTDTSQDSKAILAGTKTEAQMIADQMAARAAELKAEQDASRGDPLTDWLKSSETAQDESGSAMDLYKGLYQSPEYTGLQTEKANQKQLYNTAKNEFNMVQAKINAINAQADAIPLQIQQEFQGRGATAGGAAPIQTARLREVAIQALALQPALYAAQAKMANAQGDYQAAQDNLTEATSRMDKYFTVLMQDRQTKLEYKNRLIDRVYDYSTKKEQDQLDAIKDQNNKDFEIQKLNMASMRDLANAAIENGQGSLATQIAQLDPSSPDFQIKLGALQGQIKVNEEKALVMDLASKYADAGILPTDTLTVASAKMKNSRIYQEQVYRAPSGGGGGTGNNPVIPGVTDENGNTIIDPLSQSLLAQTGLSLPAFMFMTRGTAALTRMTADQRLQYMNEAQNYLNKTGTDVATFQSQYSALSKTVEANVLRNNQAAVAEAELEATVSNIKSAAEEAGLKTLKGLNIAKIWGGTQLNQPEASTYKFHLEQIRNEFAMYNAAISGQIDENGNIRQIIEADLKKADEIIQNGFASGSIDGFEKALKASMSKMGVVLGNSIDAQNKQVWKLFGVGDKYQNQVTDTPEVPETPESTGKKVQEGASGFWAKVGNFFWGND